MENKFERIIENLEEEETLTLGDQTFLNEMILDESIQCYDVPNFEKQTMNSAINFGAKNDTNLIILNNRTNI